MIEEITQWFTEYCQSIDPDYLMLFNEIEAQKPDISTAAKCASWFKRSMVIAENLAVKYNLDVNDFKDEYLEWAFSLDGERRSMFENID